MLCKENQHHFPYSADDKTEAEKGMKSCWAVAYMEKRPVVFLTGNESMNLPYPSTQGVHLNDFAQSFLAGELMLSESALFNTPTRLVDRLPLLLQALSKPNYFMYVLLLAIRINSINSFLLMPCT